VVKSRGVDWRARTRVRVGKHGVYCIAGVMGEEREAVLDVGEAVLASICD